jgi:hypothetical protein
VAVASLPASIDQAGNLAIGEVLAGADLGVTFRRGGFGRSPTVPITVFGATSVRCGFVMIFQGSSSATVPNTALHGTLRKAINADFMGSIAISGQNRSWRAFSVGGQPPPPQGWPRDFFAPLPRNLGQPTACLRGCTVTPIRRVANA